MTSSDLNPINVRFLRLSRNALVPTYADASATGADIFASEAHFIPGGQRSMVRTGIAIELPSGLEAHLRPCNDLAVDKGVTLLNTSGTFDQDSKGELCAVLYNTQRSVFEVSVGDRIAQLVIRPVTRARFVLSVSDFGR